MIPRPAPLLLAAALALSASRAAPPSPMALLLHTALVCSDDPVHSLDEVVVDGTNDLPVLLLSGDVHVATPTFRSREVGAALSNATLVVFPGRTHVQITAANLCAAEVMTQFVLDPTTRPDTRCAETSPLPGFVLPDGRMSRDWEPVHGSNPASLLDRYLRASLLTLRDKPARPRHPQLFHAFVPRLRSQLQSSNKSSPIEVWDDESPVCNDGSGGRSGVVRPLRSVHSGPDDAGGARGCLGLERLYRHR